MKTLFKSAKIVGIGVGVLAVFVTVLFGQRDIPLDELKAKYATEASSFVSVNGMEVHHRDEGPPTDSIPILLIHGTGSSLHTFDDWAARLSSDYRVIRMDLPGYGLTGPFPHRDYSLERYVEFLHDFLAELGVEQCILAGNSLGGGIAWRFMVEHPEMVDKLILIDASGYPSKEESTPLAFKLARLPVIKHLFTFITPRAVVQSSVENVYADKTKVTDALVDRYFELSLREGNRQAFIDKFEAENDTAAYHTIKSIEKETLVLWGDQDQLIPSERAYQFHHDLPNDTLVILKNVGHVPMEESPDQSVEVVLSFLQKSM